MRNWLFTTLLALAVCAGAFGSLYLVDREPEAIRRAAREGDALAWLKTEFRLSDFQFAAITRLQSDYKSVCDTHCAQIMAARQHHASPAEIAELEATCVRSMTEHFSKVAALMPADQGPRYLAIVMPRMSDFDHSGAPNVRMGL